MMRRISGWLSPPPGPTREARTRATLLHAILVTNFLGAGACAIVFPFFYERWLEALLVNGTISLVSVPLLVALRRGAVDAVSRLTSVLGVFAVVLSIANSGGIRSPAILAFPAALMVTGFVASVRALVGVTTFLVVALLVVGLGEDAGWLVGIPTPYSGAELWLSFSASLIVTAAVVHVSLRTMRQSLASAEESERRLVELVEQNPDGIVVVDADGCLVAANRAARALLVGPGEPLIGRALATLPSFGEAGSDVLREALASVDEASDRDLSVELVPEPGRTIFAKARLRRVRVDRGEHGVQITLRDETARVEAERERAKLEEALIQSQKMQVVGQLAGGVAHDFNNYLSVIRTCADTLRLKMRDDAKHGPLLDAISEASERSSELTRQLLAFSRKQVMQPRIVDLAEVVLGTEPMLRRTLPSRISLRVESDGMPTTVFADPSQLEVALLNLVVNARDSMPEGGELVLETGLAILPDETRSTKPGFESGLAVSLAVRDTGHGMDEATLARACEPFFTTKGKSGTGLGLSSVYGIVEQSGGKLALESRPGEGTVARILLPPVEGRVSEIRVREASPARGGSETILLVEDQPLLRQVTVDVLATHGYSVRVAASAEEALALFDDHAESIDFVLSDVVLPGLDGVSLVNRLLARRPSLPVLLVSGYTQERSLLSTELGTRHAFLQKPYSARTLLARVRSGLDGAHPEEVGVDSTSVG